MHMFEAQFKNGLPVKPVEYIDMIQDFEKHPQNTAKEENVKVFVIEKKFVDNNIGELKSTHFIDGVFYLDYEKKYLVCTELEEETKEFLSNGGTFILAYYNNKLIEYVKKIECKK